MVLTAFLAGVGRLKVSPSTQTGSCGATRLMVSGDGKGMKILAKRAA